MKYTNINQLFCSILVICLLTQTYGISLRHRINKKKIHQKTVSSQNKTYSQANQTNQNQPLTSKILKAQTYDQEQKQSQEVEENPNGFKYVGPFTKEQEEKLFPQKKYSKDQNNYNMNEATPENINDQKVVLVNNMTAAKEQFKTSKFFDDKQTLDPIAQALVGDQYKQQQEVKYPVYQNDQKAYYNPVNEKNIFNPQDNGLYVVPINFQEKPSDNEQVQKQMNIQRLARKEGVYYDASALYEVKKVDPLVETLRESAKLNAQPKAQNLGDWVKQQDQKEKTINVILGASNKQFESNTRTNVVTNTLKIQDINKVRENAALYPTSVIKKDDKDAYYNPSPKAK